MKETSRKYCRYLKKNSICGLFAKQLAHNKGIYLECEACRKNTTKLEASNAKESDRLCSR